MKFENFTTLEIIGGIWIILFLSYLVTIIIKKIFK